MEAICIKLDKRIVKNIDKSIKENNYSTRSDFIREAIRDKLKVHEKEEIIRKLKANLGFSKKKTTLEEDKRIREEVGREYAKIIGIKLD